mmetsp:Transcript_43240/g.57219  ORF Transcript_43240/g.57219 Transcript_43240/m.57219 type:complete len:225 (-) Transcript_43240:153-827(-)
MMADRKFYLQSSEEFMKTLGRKAGKVVKYSIIMRFALNLVLHRLNLFKAMKNSLSVLRLGLGCGAFNVVFHLVRRFFALKRQAKRTRKNSIFLSQEFELTCACSLASFALHIAPPNDIRILKVVIFSRAMTSLVAYVGEATGLYRPIEGEDDRRLTVEYFLAITACFFLVYCYIFAPHSMPPSLFKTVTRALAMSDGEKRLFDVLRAISELELKMGYKVGTMAK